MSSDSEKKTFKQYLAEVKQEDARLVKLTDLFEHQVYGLIPGSRNSYREDPGNTNTLTQRHAHVYAKPNGGGKQLYAANFNGSGHDGSSGIEIPGAHADFFRQKGYDIPMNNILESIQLEALDEATHFIYIFRDA
jgi:hypothetical protein